ncbi:iron-siderophore ABC transporter substrate-binding protein [Paenibacillus alvei]|uniref:iron-siderophore ABC transporter substrate-binding protein n=1 Tax=Paenibacillus alvei TaxID=44250 RepID=UPI0030B9465C
MKKWKQGGDIARLITPLGYVGAPAEMEQVNIDDKEFCCYFYPYNRQTIPPTGGEGETAGSNMNLLIMVLIIVDLSNQFRTCKGEVERMKTIKRFTVLLCACLLLIAGCGNHDAKVNTEKEKEVVQQEAASSKTASVAVYPRTITHLSGKTIVEAKPLKIATPYISFVDYMAVLDTYPIAGQGIEIIERNFPSLSKRIAGKGIQDLGMEANLEKLLAVQPDLIIAADDMKEQYERLSQIAPTVIFPQAGDWRETLKQIAEVIGEEEKAEQVLAEFDRKSAAYKEKLAFRQNESVLFTMYSGKEMFVTWNDGRFDPFYKGLGLKPVEASQANGQITLESLAALNPDHLFVINNWQNPIQGGVREAMKKSKVWNSMNAVKNNRVYELADPSLPGPMALAKIDGIEEIMQAMGKKDQ